jgi:transcriptional regulator GlxA family with amidase domain
MPALPTDDDPAGSWARAQADHGSRILGVCNGAGVLAAAGVLDGHSATAHWTRVERYAATYDRVAWASGVRFVDDGIVTTAGILSGLDGTLHVVEQMVGRDTADRAAAVIGWSRRPTDDPAHPPAGPDPVAVVNAGLRWAPDRIGVVLTPEVGELELASVFDVHGGQSLAARTVALSADGAAVTSRHGLTFLPRGVTAEAAGLDRILVPGPDGLHAGGGFAFTPAMEDLARSTDLATARWTARVHELTRRGGAGRSDLAVGPTLVPLGLGVVTACLTALLLRCRFGR